MNNPYYQFDPSTQIVSMQYNIYNDLLYVHDLYNISVWDADNKTVKYHNLHTIEESLFTNEISPEILHMEINKLSCTEDLGMSYLVTSNVFSVEIFSNNFVYIYIFHLSFIFLLFVFVFVFIFICYRKMIQFK